MPEAIWAPATGGGTWTTQLQVYTRVATSSVTLRVYFLPSATGALRGPIDIAGPAQHRMMRWTNILSTLNNLDTGFDYSGKVGALWITTLDETQRISVQARNTHTGGYGKTINGVDPFAAGNYGQFSPWRALMIQGIYKGNVYRSTLVLFNAHGGQIIVRVALIDHNDVWLGWQDITMPGWSFRAFDPFAQFGVATNHFNCRIWVAPLSGTGQIMAIGATANNTTNDPSAHVAIQYD